MFCHNCGTKNNDDNLTCTNCGAALRAPQPQQPRPAYPSQPAGPQARSAAPVQSTQNSYVIAPPVRTFDFYPFWYKFMIYAGFFMTAIGFFFIGLGQLIGWQYGSESSYRYVELIKDSFGGLRAADIISGILFLMLAFFSIFVWYQFRYLRVKAPTLTLALYGSAVGIYLVYFLIAIIVLATSDKLKFVGIKATKVLPIVFPILLIVFLIAVLAAQVFYFRSEKHLFIYVPQPKQTVAYPQNTQYTDYPQNSDYSANPQYQQNPQNTGNHRNSDYQ